MIEIGLLKKLQEVWLWFTLNFGNYTQKSLLIKILYSTNSVKWQLNFNYRHFCHLHLSSSVQNNSVQKSNIYLKHQHPCLDRLRSTSNNSLLPGLLADATWKHILHGEKVFVNFIILHSSNFQMRKMIQVRWRWNDLLEVSLYMFKGKKCA